jgi:hypothetical protein
MAHPVNACVTSSWESGIDMQCITPEGSHSKARRREAHAGQAGRRFTPTPEGLHTRVAVEPLVC